MSNADMRNHQQSITVEASPETLYDLVSDITRTGEWSPVCTKCWWDDGQSAREGAWFTGHNELPERTWETRSMVVAAERAHEFAWMVGGSLVRWGFTFSPTETGTQLTESWEFLPGGSRCSTRGTARKPTPKSQTARSRHTMASRRHSPPSKELPSPATPRCFPDSRRRAPLGRPPPVTSWQLTTVPSG